MTEDKQPWFKRLVVWLVIMRVFLYTFVSLGTAFQTATHGKSFPDLSRWDQFSICLGTFITWGLVMIAFLDRTTSRLSQGKLPNGDTEIITK